MQRAMRMYYPEDQILFPTQSGDITLLRYL